MAPDPTEPVGLTTLLDDDPWSAHHVLDTAAVYRWEKLAGEIVSA